MKTNVILNFLFAIGCVSAEASVIVPGANGTDGSLTITQDTVIDLSQAPTGSWDQDNSANTGKGVYDPEKWAVVFKYTDVTIAAGTKVTFKNNASRAPVVWLVSGNVSVAGTIDLSGESVVSPNLLPITLRGVLVEPGPGGFRGGSGKVGANALEGPGFGPGGGHAGFWSINYNGTSGGTSGAYGTASGTIVGQGGVTISPGASYGNPSLVPLIGGSGGAGSSASGASGGGAILLACQNAVSFDSGKIISKGGSVVDSSNGAGSGGGIRIVCNELLGAGNINAVGGEGASGYGWSSNAGNGRIRLERVINNNALNLAPAPSAIDLAQGATALLWPPSGAPSAKVLSVNSVDAPADPKASFGSYTPDVALPLVSSVIVVVETRNVEPESNVIVRVTPRNGMTGNMDANEATADVDSEYVPETPGVLHWKATLPTLPGYSAVQARIVRP